MVSTAHLEPGGGEAPTLVVPTGARVPPELVAAAVRAAAEQGSPIWVAIPCVLPPTLPIGAVPPRLGERLSAQRWAAVAELKARRAPGRVEVTPCRSVAAMISAACAETPPGEIVLAGSAPWTLRRAIHGLAPVTTMPSRNRHRAPTRPAGRPALEG
jgi:hypothetical protein